MFTWIGKYWKWCLLGVAVLLIAYGAWHRTDKKLFNMLAKTYNQEQAQVTEDLTDEVAKLDKEKQDVQNQLAQVQKDKVAYAQKYADATRRIDELNKKIKEIMAPTDPDALATDLHKRGYGSATHTKRPNIR